MASEKTFKGQTFISGKSLYQDLLYIVETGGKLQHSEAQDCLIEDIWSNLMGNPKSSSEPAVKSNAKGDYFYWEIDETDIETEKTVKVKVTCPKPDPIIFNYDYEEKAGDSDWAKYWRSKMKSVQDSKYNSSNAMFPTEVNFPGTKFINQHGDQVVIEDTSYSRTDLGDIQNLLNSIF